MQFSLLADEPAAAETVARWYYDQWCKDSGRYSLDFVIENVSAAVNRDKPPMIVLAKDSGGLIGAAELKIREMEAYPQFEFWVGGVYVVERCRSRGVASKLLREVMARARQAGITKLYLQTEELSGGLYALHGFKPVEEADSKGVRVLVMVADLG